MPEAGFRVEVAGGVPVVTAPEEIDVTNAPGLRAALLEAAGHGHGNGNGMLAVDMSRTRFCDSSTVNVLVRAHQRARTAGGELVLVISAAAVLRIFSIIGADRVIPNFASLDEALGRPCRRAWPYPASSDPLASR